MLVRTEIIRSQSFGVRRTTLPLAQALQVIEPDRRVVHRRPVLKSGKIAIDTSRCIIDCTIRDISETGALILAYSPAVPAYFDLVSEGTTRRCVVVWRRPDRLGVRFSTSSVSSRA